MTDQKQPSDRLRNDLRSIEDNLTSGEIFRLQQARNTALAGSSRTKFNYFWPSFGSALAASILLSVLVFDRNTLQPQIEDQSQHLAADLAVYLEGNDDELDVYYWLAESDEDLDLLYGLAYSE